MNTDILILTDELCCFATHVFRSYLQVNIFGFRFPTIHYSIHQVLIKTFLSIHVHQNKYSDFCVIMSE